MAGSEWRGWDARFLADCDNLAMINIHRKAAFSELAVERSTSRKGSFVLLNRSFRKCDFAGALRHASGLPALLDAVSKRMG